MGCVLKDYPREMNQGPTANFVTGELIACYENTCEIYDNGEWNHLVDTTTRRIFHSSAVNENKILLIGGSYPEGSSISTEWISKDGSPSQPGPFQVRNGYTHCTIQVTDNVILVTGGYNTESYVTQYQLTDKGSETPRNPMKQPRRYHACGVYQNAGGQKVRMLCGVFPQVFLKFDFSPNTDTQVLLVTGGFSPSRSSYIDSTEVGLY